MTVVNVNDRWSTPAGGSWKNFKAVAPGATIHEPALQALYCGVAGDVTIVNSNGDQGIFVAMVGWNYIEAKQVLVGPASIIGCW